MRKMGYRLYVRPEWVVPLIENYGKHFQTLEVKATANFIKDVYVQSFVDFCEKMGIQTLIFHLTDVFDTEKSCGATCDFLSEMEQNSSAISTAYFVGETLSTEDFLHVISRTVKDNSLIFALENMPCKKLFPYLKTLKSCAIKYGFKICIDVANLFYSKQRSGVSYESLIGFFKNDTWWRENVVLIHFHDYNAKGCFLNFGDGYIGKNSEQLKSLLKCFNEDCPIVLKTPVQDFTTQGIVETKAFLEFLEE